MAQASKFYPTPGEVFRVVFASRQHLHVMTKGAVLLHTRKSRAIVCLIGWRGETRVKSSVLLLMGAKSSVLFLMGTKSSVLLVLCTLAVELRNGGRHPFGDCTLRMELRDSHISHSLSSILYVQYSTVPMPSS